MLTLPPRVIDLEAWLLDTGEVFARIDGHDSGCVSRGIVAAGDRWFVKAAFGEQAGQIDEAVRVSEVFRHPAVVPVVGAFDVRRDGEPGRSLVAPWVDGQVLNDAFATGRHHSHPSSTLNRFRELPLGEVVRAFETVLDAHLEAERCGLVAVDFYDGCLIHDSAGRATWLVDVGHYRPPYTLLEGRQLGSTRFMAPEEWERGARIDHRTTVFTLGRTGRVLLCRSGGDEATFRGTTRQLEVLERATRPEPGERQQTVAELLREWRDA